MKTFPRERFTSSGLGANGLSGVSIGVEPFCGGLVTGASGGSVELGSGTGDWLGIGTCVQATIRRAIVNKMLRYFILPPKLIFPQTIREPELFLQKGEQNSARLWLIHVKIIYGPRNLILSAEISKVHLSGLLIQLPPVYALTGTVGSLLQAKRL